MVIESLRPTTATAKTAIPGQGRAAGRDEHAQRQQQDVDEVDQGLAAKPEDRDPGAWGFSRWSERAMKTRSSRTAAAPATAR
jgi:hypothetical protein